MYKPIEKCACFKSKSCEQTSLIIILGIQETVAKSGKWEKNTYICIQCITLWNR